MVPMASVWMFETNKQDVDGTAKGHKQHIRTGDRRLESKVVKGSRVSIAAASFSIYAFEALKEELENVEELRFIFTSPTFITILC